MKNIKRSLALVLSIVLALSLFSCTSASLPKENDTCVATVNGKYEVSYDTYKYFYLNYAAIYDEADFEGEKRAETEAEIRKETESAIINVYAVVDFAEKYGITLDNEMVKTAAKVDIDSAIKQFETRGAYAEALRANYMTDSVFRFMMTLDALEDQVFAVLTTGLGIIDNSDETVKAAIDSDEFARITHVLISHNNGFSDDKNLKTAEKVLRLAKNGEDFDNLIANYSNDYSMTPDGYYFTHGYMLEEIENTVFELEIGEISEIVRTVNGYHIIKRLAKDPAYLEKNYETLKAQYESCKFYGLIDEHAKTLTVSVNESASEINTSLLTEE